MIQSDEQKLVNLLKKLEPGFLPYEIFIQIARLAVLPIVEFVPLRMNNGQVEVLLLSRGPKDLIWPNELHTPGTVVRPTDTDAKLYQAFVRILHEELLGTPTSDPHFVGNILHKSRRGMEQAQVYWVEIQGPPKVGDFYSTSDLPLLLMESQKVFILEAVKSYKETILSS